MLSGSIVHISQNFLGKMWTHHAPQLQVLTDCKAEVHLANDHPQWALLRVSHHASHHAQCGLWSSQIPQWMPEMFHSHQLVWTQCHFLPAICCSHWFHPVFAQFLTTFVAMLMLWSSSERSEMCLLDHPFKFLLLVWVGLQLLPSRQNNFLCNSHCQSDDMSTASGAMSQCFKICLPVEWWPSQLNNFVFWSDNNLNFWHCLLFSNPKFCLLLRRHSANTLLSATGSQQLQQVQFWTCFACGTGKTVLFQMHLVFSSTEFDCWGSWNQSCHNCALGFAAWARRCNSHFAPNQGNNCSIKIPKKTDSHFQLCAIRKTLSDGWHWSTQWKNHWNLPSTWANFVCLVCWLLS